MHVNNAVLAVVEGGRGRAAGKTQRVTAVTSPSAEEAGSTKGQHKSTTEVDCYSLFVSDGLVAAVAHTHLELEAHEGDGGAFGRTLATHCLATLPAVVLRDTRGLQHVSLH